MKKGILFSLVVGLSLALGSLALFNNQTDKEYYQPRNEVFANEGFQGGAQWLHERRANQITGEINPADVIAARNQLKSMNADSKAKKTTLGLQWEEIGPDNFGGRTRAFLVASNGTFYAGAVSGGLFKSTNSGSGWTAINDFQDNLAVISLAEAPNGDIYYGTGEGMYYSASGSKSQGIIGGGLFKSTNDGASFEIVTSTLPTNSPSSEFAAIGKIVIDPNNAQRITIATNRGLRLSEDGGDSWVNPLDGQSAGSSPCLDMVISSSGQIWAKLGSLVYKSPNGAAASYTEISKLNGTTTELPRNASRMRLAISPQDENYVYAVAVTTSNNFNRAYRTLDGGATWSEIGSANSFLDPHSGQGTYNNALTVDPKNKDRIIVGGVTLWEWSLTGGWQQIATNNRFQQLVSLWVHSDIHNVVFDPNNLNKIYVTSDGGISRSSDNGQSWVPIVKNYGTIQFYDIGVGGDGSVIGGTQDNSNILIDPNANILAKTGITLNSGDGGYADISKLNPNVIFLESQYGNAGRSADFGASAFSNFFDLDRMAPNPTIQPGSGFQFADFVAPFELYENVFDFNSTDFITFGADSVSASAGLGLGKTTFEGSFIKPQASTDFLIDGVTVIAGAQKATSDANGDFVGDVSAGSFDPATGEFEVTFNSGVSGFEVLAKVAVKYDAGDTVQVKSLTNGIPLTRVLTNALASNQSINYQDPIQSAFFMGLTGRSSTTNTQGGIWMTRNAISNVAVTPEWWHVGDVGNNERPTCMGVSADGDVLYVGCSSGRVYRYSNLAAARDSASADIDGLYSGTTLVRASTSVVQRTTISGGLPNSRVVTEINFDPKDKNKVIVTLGNYGNSNYIYYSSNATATSPIFTSKHSNLPNFPVYTGIFNAFGPTGQVIIGAENGVFTTDDISVANPVWTQEITGFANVPVFDLVQKLTVRRDIQLFGNVEGSIYAGTHGRGVFRTTTTQTIGLDENDLDDEVVDNKTLKLYPNPSASQVFVPLNLTNRSDVVITVRDINGKLLRNMKLDRVSQDVENVELNVEGLAAGTYIVTLMKGSEVISGKLIKR